MELGKYDAALADYSQSINRDPRNPNWYVNRGVAQYRMGRYAPAIADFTQAILLESEDPIGYFYRGLSYDELPLPDKLLAIPDLEKAAALGYDRASVDRAIEAINSRR